MQLAGPNVFGPPPDWDGAVAFLRAAVELGVDHIDTSQYCGPDFVNELIREALHPYPAHLVLISKVGNVPLIPGPSSLPHLAENMASSSIHLDESAFRWISPL
jgi:aryl-alcohol dehydrogenase-like predicted oxidoreductase